jgi:NhaP-type Na+/H+ or K+/H+ antiporter
VPSYCSLACIRILSADAVSRLVTTVSRFELILLLMAVVVALELVARRIRMPPAAAFILGGIALALIPGTPDVELDPDLALVAAVAAG